MPFERGSRSADDRPLDEKAARTAARFRDGGVGMRFAVGTCSLGFILVAASPCGVTAIFLGDAPDALSDELRRRFPEERPIAGGEAFGRLFAEVVGFIEEPSRGLDLPLDVRGTAFQRRVWQALRAIPPGVRVSYREIARRIGAPRAARAVARACAANPLAVAIPCHRVVRTDGELSGYHWGAARKEALLRREIGLRSGREHPGARALASRPRRKRDSRFDRPGC
ncbi:methylated-DNA--[protein]-cysteine S-methyltransferase [Methylacidimicrobium sp. AP8]|uniref:methylated-DNA--[protein]-cysteine S-methyltransferase n=1 Tax=Methylacidimicrobium sp. AP8 TaxID=2730359 RepID=UPI00351C67F4